MKAEMLTTLTADDQNGASCIEKVVRRLGIEEGMEEVCETCLFDDICSQRPSRSTGLSPLPNIRPRRFPFSVRQLCPRRVPQGTQDPFMTARNHTVHTILKYQKVETTVIQESSERESIFFRRPSCSVRNNPQINLAALQVNFH